VAIASIADTSVATGTDQFTFSSGISFVTPAAQKNNSIMFEILPESALDVNNVASFLPGGAGRSGFPGIEPGAEDTDASDGTGGWASWVDTAPTSGLYPTSFSVRASMVADNPNFDIYTINVR
jgi:hypothetical protein